jgi:fused signal recognition particle receptor
VPSEEISILSKAPAKELVEVAIADEIKKVAPVVQEDPFAQSKSLKQALSNTEKSIWGRLAGIFSSETEDQHFDELEEILYTSDIGPQTVERLMESVRAGLSRAEKKDLATLKKSLKSEFLEIFENANIPEPKSENPFAFLKLDFKPAVWMIVGVNGAGKTTSIGKLAAHLAKDGKKVLVAAGDTFRAAAGNQLRTWTDRAQVEIFSPEGVTDPSAVAFDAVAKAKAQGYDVVIVDTAGRLHTQSNLMEELKKMKRVMTKVIPDAPHETLIVLDANSGQNALVQAKEFHQALGLTGVILTKMDGTAKGGVAVGLANELKIPIRLIGVGEKIGDLRPFSAQEFINALF